MKAVQEVLHKERQQWLTEKHCLLETLSSTKEALKEIEEESKTSTERLVDELKHLQQERDNFQERKKKKKKRIVNVFRSSKKVLPH